MLDGTEPEPLPEPSDDQVERVAGLIDGLLANDQSKAAVAEFYDPTTMFAGDTFLALAPNDPYAIGIADLYAVTLLEVSPGAPAARELLPGGRRASLAASLLARMPLGTPLWDATDRDLAWTGELWTLLTSVRNVGSTIAGKILARKRPELVPVVDSVVANHLSCQSGTYWTTFRRVLQNQARRTQIAEPAPHVPVLRALDSLLWMSWR
jgi:hypothetical protein